MNQKHNVAENKINQYKIYIYQASCPLPLPLLNSFNCKSILICLSLYNIFFYICMTAISPIINFMIYLLANLVVACLLCECFRVKSRVVHY